MSILYADDYLEENLLLTKGSDDFFTIQRLKLRVPSCADWAVIHQADVMTQECVDHLEYAIMGFILGIACDASQADIQQIAQLAIQKEALLRSYLAAQPEIKGALWVYLTNVKFIISLLKRYFSI